MRSKLASLALIAMLGGLATMSTAPQRPIPDRGTIQVPGASLPFITDGKGTPCVIYGSEVYYPRTFSSRFKAAMRCVHLPERGFIPDARRRDSVPFGIAEAVADIEAARRQLGLERFVLVGHSIHGLVVLAYAAAYPQHLTHVVAIGAPPGVPMVRDSVVAYRTRAFSAARQVQHAKNRLAIDSLRRAYPDRPLVSNYIANAALYWADSSFDSAPLWEGVHINAPLANDLQVTAFAWDTAAAPVSVPAFIALGRHDYVVPPNLWSGPRTPFRSLTVQTFTRAGHTPQLEEPEEFDRLLLRWLGR